MTTAPTITLYRGSHPADDCGNPERCFWEWHNWLTGRGHTDARPPGVSPVLHAWGMRLNDALDDTKRQELIFALPNGEDRFAGTADDGLDEVRMLMAADWAIHTGARTWLRAAGLDEDEAELAALPPITSRAASRAARLALYDLRDRLRATRSAFYGDLRAKILAKLAEKPAAVADGVAIAVTDGIADAVTNAVADAVTAAITAATAAADAVAATDAGADAVADAVAATVAVADAAAVAIGPADADAAMDAAADAVGDAAGWTAIYKAAHQAAYDVTRKAIAAKHAPAIAAVEDSAIALYRAMIRPQAA